MRLVIAVLFWVGLFGTVWELLYARKHRIPITRAETLYLVLVLPVSLGVQLVIDLVGIPRNIAAGGAALAIGMALNGWVIKRRVQRTAQSVSQ